MDGGEHVRHAIKICQQLIHCVRFHRACQNALYRIFPALRNSRAQHVLHASRLALSTWHSYAKHHKLVPIGMLSSGKQTLEAAKA